MFHALCTYYYNEFIERKLSYEGIISRDMMFITEMTYDNELQILIGKINFQGFKFFRVVTKMRKKSR